MYYLRCANGVLTGGLDWYVWTCDLPTHQANEPTKGICPSQRTYEAVHQHVLQSTELQMPKSRIVYFVITIEKSEHLAYFHKNWRDNKVQRNTWCIYYFSDVAIAHMG